MIVVCVRFESQLMFSCVQLLLGCYFTPMLCVFERETEKIGQNLCCQLALKGAVTPHTHQQLHNSELQPIYFIKRKRKAKNLLVAMVQLHLNKLLFV